MLVILALWSVAFCFTSAFICGLNFSMDWQPLIVAGSQCLSPVPITTVYVISDVVLDLGLLIMPIPLVR